MLRVRVPSSAPILKHYERIVWGNDEQVPKLIWISEEYSDKIDTVRKVNNGLSICGYRISANTPAFQAGKVGSIPTTRSILNKLIKNVEIIICGSGSMVERHLAKVDVAGSSPVFRSNFKTLWTDSMRKWWASTKAYMNKWGVQWQNWHST